jgi:UV DNA damage endonuclease
MEYLPKNFNLGYACINTELRKKDIFMSRTCRLSTLQSKGLDYVKSLAIQNLKDILVILQWNLENNIFFMRLSSEIFPFASHAEHGYSLNFADSLLKEVGCFAKKHNMRVTMHPGQYNVLSSPNDSVIKNTFLDLNHHCDILDRMELDQNSIIIVHGGGTYGDKQKALKRLEENILNLPKNTRDRLVIENCEMAYCIEDLLPLSVKLQIPIVIDLHHDDIYPSSQPVSNYFRQVFQIWYNRNIKPKIHISNSVKGVCYSDSKTARRKHSDYIDHLHTCLQRIKFPLDVMLEAKMKEQAILHLRKILPSINNNHSDNNKDNDSDNIN